MDPVDQLNLDDICIEALKHTIEANNRTMEEFKRYSANMCAKIKGNLNKNHEAMSQYLEKLGQVLSSDEEKKACADVKKKLDKLHFTVSEFYEKEYVKCCQSTSFDESSFDRFYQEQGIAGLDDEAEDDKDQIHLCSVQDSLDRQIERAKLVFKRQFERSGDYQE